MKKDATKTLHLQLSENTNRLLKIYKSLKNLNTLSEAGEKIIKEAMEDFEKAIKQFEKEGGRIGG